MLTALQYQQDNVVDGKGKERRNKVAMLPMCPYPYLYQDYHTKVKLVLVGMISRDRALEGLK